MQDLFLAIALTSILFLLFRAFESRGIQLFPAVVINYITCVITGLLFISHPSALLNVTPTWPPLALFTGSLFLGTFFLMGYTVQKVSVAAATVANKISLVIPFLVNLFLFHHQSDHLLQDILATVIAIVAIVMISISGQVTTTSSGKYFWILPVIIFLMGGFIDSLINYLNLHLLPEKEQEFFPIFAFSAAAGIGTLILIYRHFAGIGKIHWKDVAGGILLGIPNYFSIYYVLRALSHFHNNGAVLFPVLNVGIILFSAFCAYILFKDKPNRKQLVGMLLALISLALFLPPGSFF